MKRAVVITGLGVRCALGPDIHSFWNGLLAGRTPVAPTSRFPSDGLRSPMAFEAEDPGGAAPNLGDRLALAAAREALAAAGLSAAPAGCGVAVGASVGGLPESEEAFGSYLADGHLGGRLRPFLGHLPSTAASRLGLAFAADGPHLTVASACSSGTIAIGLASRWIAGGEASTALAGGTDALSRLTLGGFNSLRLVSGTGPAPFDPGRSGMVIGEGAAFLVLEAEEAARSRGAGILARVLGFGMSTDGHHATSPDPTGGGPLKAMRAALDEAGLTPADVDHVNAHGTATPANDAAEGTAIAALLGGRAGEVPVVSVKGATGHCLGAAGAVEAVASVLSLVHGMVPPCAGHAELDPSIGLRVPTAPVHRPLRTVLSVNLAFGGSNAALLLGRAE